LRDGREVWIDGDRVSDVTTHPAFRNAARSVARMYDALHDPDLFARDPERLARFRKNPLRPSHSEQVQGLFPIEAFDPVDRIQS